MINERTCKSKMFSNGVKYFNIIWRDVNLLLILYMRYSQVNDIASLRGYTLV